MWTALAGVRWERDGRGDGRVGDDGGEGGGVGELRDVEYVRR